MIKVLLVDDDVPVVEYLHKLVPWDKLDMQVCASAYSCAEAREAFQTAAIDVMITDIGLPDGNGIELARALRSQCPELRVVFLTCHEDFQYVQEALRIEADDYIVKDELNPDKIIESMRKAAGKVHKAQYDLEKMSYKSDLERNRDLLRQNFFQEVLHASDPKSKIIQGKRLGVEWNEPYFCAALCALDLGRMIQVYGNKDLDLVRYASYNIAMELASNTRITPFLSKGSQLWLISNASGYDDARDVLLTYLYDLRAKVNEFLRIDVFCLISDYSDRISGLKELAAHIRDHLMVSYYKTVWLERVITNHGKEHTQLWGEVNRDIFEDYVVKWIQSLEKDERPHVQMYIGAVEKLLLHSKPHPRNAQEFLSHMVQEAVYKLGISSSEAVHPYLTQTIRASEAVQIIRSFSDRLMTVNKTAAQTGYNDTPALKDINALIHDNFHKNLTSIDAARFLHLNPSYFCRYFKKIAGINFTDYVHLTKMEEAKRLFAEKNESAENVAYMLGYSDRAYFSKVFKKYTGKNPSEYKQQE